MKFIRTFAGGAVTAFLTVEDGVSVRWRGQPTKSILPEYGKWMRDSLQTVANATGKSILYAAPGSENGPMVVVPQQKAQDAQEIENLPKACRDTKN